MSGGTTKQEKEVNSVKSMVKVLEIREIHQKVRKSGKT